MYKGNGTVFDIQRYSIHDGKGIRTIIFLKGCPLKCRWCSNPESQKPIPELFYMHSKCIGCGMCVQACPQKAIALDQERIQIDRDVCSRCFECTKACPSTALIQKGVLMTVEEVVHEAIKDRVFFDKSDGGITISGGEPFFQHEFTIDILKSLKSRGIHTAVETTGFVPWGHLESALPFIDTVLFDFKHCEEDKHKENTDVSNALIKANLRKVLAAHNDVIVRIPVIPGFNDDQESIEAICACLHDLRS